MNALTIAIAYYENPAMLLEQQRIISGYPADLREKTRLIVVDDGSPRDPAHKVAVQPDGYELEVYRILVDRPWGQLGARNLGMHVAPAGSWVLATDIDHILPGKCAAKLLEFKPKAGHYYTFARRMPDGSETTPHPNSYLMNRDWFWNEVGGCNEDLLGWYGTDCVFRKRAAMFGRKVELPVHLVVYNRGGTDIGGIEGSATRAWGRKKTKWHARTNPRISGKLTRAHLFWPAKPLRFDWERVL